jgi:flagellar motor switch protein FliN
MTALEEIKNFADISMDVDIELDRKKMTVREILALTEGCVITMSRSAGENIDVLIGGAVVGSGEVVIFEDTVAVRITDFREES